MPVGKEPGEDGEDGEDGEGCKRRYDCAVLTLALRARGSLEGVTLGSSWRE